MTTKLISVTLRAANVGGWDVFATDIGEAKAVDHTCVIGSAQDALHEATEMSVKWNNMGHLASVSNPEKIGL